MLNKFFFTKHKLFYLVVVSLLLHLIAAYFSEGFYEQDEHFSILEPITFKLGYNATLGWDFFYNYDKQWFLSFFFYYIIKFLSFLNIDSPFKWMLIIRGFSALLGWISVISLIHISKKILKDEKNINLCFYISTLFWFYPYFHARPASESISISFLIIALSIFIHFYKSNKLIFICGLIFGLSIVTRYTNIFLIGSFGLWLIIFNKKILTKIILLFCGFLIIFLLGIIIDYWGYGKFIPVFLNYFLLNYEWSQMDYYSTNTNSWWYNFYFILTEFLPPISILIILSMLIFWIRYPKNIITWTTLPYFIFLCTTPHKETRFLFPILSFSPIFLSAALDNLPLRFKIILKKILELKFSSFIKYILISINILALITLIFIPANQSTLLFKFLYKNEYNINKIYTLDKIPYKKSDLLINFYRNDKISFVKIANANECKIIETENNLILIDKNKEYLVKEIQKYSYPKWTFNYYVQCNKEEFKYNFVEKLQDEATYYISNRMEYFHFFNEDQI